MSGAGEALRVHIKLIGIDSVSHSHPNRDIPLSFLPGIQKGAVAGFGS